MSTRPSNKSFLNWCGSDQNKLKFENALRTYPDFANVKNEVFLLNDILIGRIIYLFIKSLIVIYAIIIIAAYFNFGYDYISLFLIYCI